MSEHLQARLIESSAGYSVDAFLPGAPPTPGNVAICISGGGSRSLSAGMGQLRALRHLTLGQDDLIALSKAISTVSGGSWVGSTFVYLQGDTTDDEYLNLYVPDPGRLVPSATAGHSPAETLDELPDGNVGKRISRKMFSIPLLGLQAFLLYKLAKTPPSQLWQALIGLYILRHYGLFPSDDHFVPTSLFTYDEATRERDVTFGGRQLTAVQADFVASGAGRSRRPFLICNTAMFVEQAHQVFRLLVPVQCTPFFCGIVGLPDGVDANGRRPGGGGVTSFGLGSDLAEIQGVLVEIDQDRPFAFADAVGCSSAAFAEGLQNLFAQWEDDPTEMMALMKEAEEDVRAMFQGRGGLRDDGEELVDTLLRLDDDAVADLVRHDLRGLRSIIPQYRYWPVRDASPAPGIQPTRFADAGSLENSAVAAALVYSDVESVICFVNTDRRLAEADMGVIGPDGLEIPNTRVIVSEMIPPLYGYQPYAKGKGYVLYEGAAKPELPIFMHNQVFDSARFAEVVQGLWAASNGYTRPAVFLQTDLAVLDNAWLGVVGAGQKIKLLWVHLARVREWYDLLSDDVKAILGDFDDPSSFSDFPHYSTFDTDLSATQVNLLAQLTSWIVAAEGNRDLFLEMYR